MSDLGKRIANLTPEKRVLLERHLLNKGRSSLLTKLEIRRRGTADPCVLSFAQQRLWFLDQLDPGSSAYNIPLTVRLSGHLNVTALQQSIGEILRRHEVLRTTFSTENDQPVQRITPATAFRLPEADLSAMTAEQREAKAKELATEEASRPFDLVTGPLLRAMLLRLNPENHVLLLTMHHIISDGWSMGILYRELSVLYEAFLKGNPSPLPELPIQYADFAVWQREWLQGKKLEEQLTFWKEQLRDITTLELPTDRPRPSVQTFQGATHTLQISKDLTETLKDLSRKEGATLFMMLLAAFQSLLHRYTGQDDIVVGTPIANRNRAEIEGLIGFFVNTLVMRTDTSGNPVFRELLKRVRKSTLDAYAHQDLPFETLIMELQPERDLSRNPLFQVMFALQNVPVSTLEFPALTVSHMGLENTRTRFDLEIHLKETADGLKCTFVYNTDLFDSTTIERMAGHYQMMLEGISANPDLRLSELPLLTEAERHQLLVEWNNTDIEYPRDKCIHALFEVQVERTPDAIAVVFEDQQLTYRKLNSRANQLAHYLRRFGVGPEVLVGICVERSVEMVIGLLGILKAGGAYVPLDPSYPQEWLAFMVRDAAAKVLLTEKRCEHLFAPAHNKTVCLDSDWPLIDREDQGNPDSGTVPSNLAYVMYTSGSTGSPKGAMILHSGVVNYLTWAIKTYRMDAGGSVPVHSSISFDLTVTSLYAPLLAGGQVELLSEDSAAQNLLAALRRNKGRSLVKITPAHLELLNHQLGSEEIADMTKTFVIGGENLPAEKLRLWREFAPATRLINEYGPTETVVGCCVYEVRPDDPHNGSVPIGRPIDNTQLYVLDPDLQPVQLGATGELYIGGVGVARGYWNRPELTKERFLPDPFSGQPGARLYKSGDLARYRKDGILQYLGRADHQVKIRGFRVELGEIEAVLGQHPAVRETVVIAREDNPANRRLIAYTILNQGSAISANELRGFLKEKLPDYMVPSAFVVLDSLPLTPNGKVDRKALPEPDRERRDLEDSYIAPRTPIEELLASIWGEVLGLKRVGIYDNFFDLGGDSLSAIRIIARTHEAFGLDLTPITLFEGPSVAKLAECIPEAPARPVGLKMPTLPCSLHGRVAPLSSGQQEIWLTTQLFPDLPIYNEPFTVYLNGSIDLIALERAINRLIHRHEILRTAFSTKDGRPVQIVHEEARLKLRVEDMQSFGASDREAEALRLVTVEAQQPFDLGKPPLLRAMLIRFGDSDDRLYLVFHHIVTDAFSMYNVFAPELWAHYKSACGEREFPPAELPLQYRHYAKWQREWLQTSVPEAHVAYWRRQLDGALPLELPADRRRPPTRTFRGAYQTLSLSRELTQALKKLGHREGATLYMVLLGAFQVLLWRYTYQDDVVVGTAEAGRAKPELEALLGYFLNMLAIRTDLSGNPRFRELLRRVRRVALEAYAHKDLPFTVLVEAMKPPREPVRHPLFQIAFVMEPSFPAQESGWTVSQLEIQTGTAKFDLILELEERAEGIIGRFEYNTDLFDAATVERMIGHYRMMLEGIAANPDLRLSELPLLTEDERHQLLVEWNHTDSDYPRDRCIHELFEEQVEKTPDAVAVVFEDQKLTYRELNSKANQLAHYLRKQGVGPEILVGICVERSLEMLLGLLGILKAGGAYMPLDPLYPSDRLAFMLEDARPPVLLAQRKLQESLPAHHAVVVCIEDIDLSIEEGTAPLSIEHKQSNLAYVLYTSGSTGKPKGVLIPHRAVVNFLTAMRKQLGMTDTDTLLAVTTLSFDIAVLELFLPLTAGACVCIAGREVAADGERLACLLSETGATVMQATPVTWQMLVESGWQGSQILKILCGGETLRQDLAEELVSRSAYVWNLYGPTETTIWSSISEVKAGQHVTIGRPIANTQFYILDRYLQMLPIGVRGELFISGDGLALGYLNSPELTDEKFIPNPFSHEPGALMYRTGDLARYLPDGNVGYLGRLDNQVKIRGYRIELAEIEAVLAQHPAVRETVVFAREDQPGNKQLMAYAVLNEKPAVTNHELRNFLRQKLPDYMIPSAFVVLNSLPVTPNGKIDRRALPAPDSERPNAEDSYVAPRSPIEEVLAGIWCEVLGLNQVGVHDNFFDLGGHSLLATQVISRVRLTFDEDVPLRCLFESPTVAGLATALLQGTDETEKLEKRSGLLIKLAYLSEDEINNMLAEQIRHRR